MAGSPDGKWVYMTGLSSSGVADGSPVVVRIAADGKDTVRPFIGKWNEKKKGSYEYLPGSDNDSLNNPSGLDCDAEGRIYVADNSNGRIQVFSPDGKYLKSIVLDRPTMVRVHQKTGAIYVVHAGRVQGKSVDRITKLASFGSPTEVYHVDDLGSPVMGLDSWSAKPRIWLAGKRLWVDTAGGGSDGTGVRIYEEDGNTLKKIADFAEDAKKEAGNGWFGGFGATRKVICDPVREKIIYGNSMIIDLKTGAYQGQFRLARRSYDDIAFDKKGYMHVHWNPCFELQGVSRVDPSQARSVEGNAVFYPEVPYDYGVEKVGPYNVTFLGILPVKDQGGAKGFQDGIGVNMRGDVAVQSNIYYVPKMEDVGRGLADMGPQSAREETGFTCAENTDYASFMKQMEEGAKRGEEIYSIRRRPGIPLAGGTVWVYDSTGVLRKECAVNAGKLINGVQIDEDGSSYFVTARPRAYGETYFLAGKGGTFGDQADKGNIYPFTGTLVKSAAGKECFAVLADSPIALEERPARPADLMSVAFADVFGKNIWCWMEGSEWLYAGASPIVSTGCSCPTQRLHTDWYRRTYVPESYRHSFGIVDTAGNLVMHLGRYGNQDSANAMKPGSDDITVFSPRFISGTDNYICFEDWGERLTVLKIAYHAEESVGIQ
ncbi:MAG: hypothetical protein C0404_07145 [Verrucomicrobia bacterium]|nr:hypothetical protein [Verrucomicrobiota bacterium]